MPLISRKANAPAPTDYAGAAQVLAELPTRTTTERTRRGLTLKQAAVLVGVTDSTLAGVEAGSNCTRATATAVLRWLATS